MIFLEFVVVCAALTVTAPPAMVMSPAASTSPVTVVLPLELDISTAPRDVIGAPLVISPELVSRTVPALIAPVPVVFRVDAALVIERSPEADMVEVVDLA